MRVRSAIPEVAAEDDSSSGTDIESDKTSSSGDDSDSVDEDFEDGE